MNKLYRLPLRTRAKNLSSGVRRRQNSSKLVLTGAIALGGVAVLVAFGFLAFHAIRHLTGKPKAPAVAAHSSAATPSPTVPALKPKDILLPLSDPNKAASGEPASSPSAVSPQSSPPVLISTASPSPAPSVAPPEPKTVSPAKEADKPLSKAARKTLEKKRLEAERKRAHLEKMYQNHEISTDDYTKSKEEYRVEIQKYRNAIKAGE
jgi:cytoskeletal protein RodZ